MIHRQFEYRRKLVWAALFLIVFFSTASSMMRKERENKNMDVENACTQTDKYEFSVFPFLALTKTLTNQTARKHHYTRIYNGQLFLNRQIPVTLGKPQNY